MQGAQDHVEVCVNATYAGRNLLEGTLSGPKCARAKVTEDGRFSGKVLFNSYGLQGKEYPELQCHGNVMIYLGGGNYRYLPVAKVGCKDVSGWSGPPKHKAHFEVR